MKSIKYIKQQLKTDIVHQTFTHFISELDSIILDKLSLDNIMYYANKFNDNNVQRFYIARNIYRFLIDNKELNTIQDNELFQVIRGPYNKVYSFINNIKQHIPFDIFLLISFYMLGNKPYIEINFKYILDNLNKKHFSALWEVVHHQFITVRYEEPIFNKVLSICFKPKELQVIKPYIDPVQEQLLKWFFSSYILYENFIVSFIRYKIVICIFMNYNATDDHKYVKTMKQYFSNELIADNMFLYKCCRYKLLTKSFINKVYNKHNEYLFKVIIENSLQYKDYINSLLVLNELQ